MPSIYNSREELLNLFPDNNSQLIEAKDLRAFVNAIYDEAVIIGEDVINDLNSAIIELPLSADQGRILNMTKENYLSTPAGEDYVLSSDLNDNRFWIPQVRKLGQLDDVSTQDPVNGSVLTWSESKQMWVPAGAMASSFIEKGGVPWKSHISYPAGYVVTYKDNLYFSLVDMVPNRPPDIYPGGWQLIQAIEKLSDLDDVDTSGSNIGYYLKSDEFGDYTPSSFTQDVSLVMESRLKEGLGIDIIKESGTNDLKITLNANINDLQDVTSINPTLGSLLVYDGSKWTPEDIVDTIDKGGTVWQSSALYPAGTLVSYGGNIYISIYSNVGEQPDQSNAWEVYSLETLPDVNIRNVVHKDVITYNALTQQWTPLGTTENGGDPVYGNKIPRLNDDGKLDSNMIEVTMFHRIDSWDPSLGQEYPDTTGHTPGAFWDILFVGSETQWTYQTGDLVGKTVYPGDFIIWGIGGWTIMPAAMNPLDYYRRDGDQPITNHFQADGYRLVNVGEGIDLSDAVTLSQLTTKEDDLGVPAENGYILQSDVMGNRSWIENLGGLQEVYWTDIKGTEPLDNPELAEEFDKKANTIDVFDKTEYINDFTGQPGVPIITASNGKISPNLISVESLHYVGVFTPTSGDEYPDTTGETFGSFWIVTGLTLPYTFMGGDLAGRTVNNNDYMVWGSDGWDIMESTIDPDLYYKLDGTVAITAPFAGGNQQIKNIAQGTNDSDAVNMFQHNQHKDNLSNPHQVTKAQIGLDNVENISPEDMPISDDVQSALDGKENWLGNPTIDGMILSSTASGSRSWVYANNEATWGLITGDINNQTDLMDQLNEKVNKTGDHITGDLQVDGNLKSPKIFIEANNSNYESSLRFENISSGLNTTISWSNLNNKFTVSDAKGDLYDLLHTGVINPDDYLLKSGGIMTGALHLHGLPVDVTEAVNKEYVDSRTISNPADIMLKSVYDLNDNGIVDHSEDSDMLGGQTPDYYAAQVDLDTKLDKSGGTVTGHLEIQGQFTTTGSARLNEDTEISKLKIGVDPVTDISRIDFSDQDAPNNEQYVYWSASNKQFRFMNYTGTSYFFWHSGNFDKDAYLKLSGGTMTGTLTLDEDPVNDLEAATKHYVDDQIQNSTPDGVMLTSVYDPDENGIVDNSQNAILFGGQDYTYYATKDDLNDKLDNSGGTITGDLEVQGTFTTNSEAYLNGSTVANQLKIGLDPNDPSKSMLKFSDNLYPNEDVGFVWDSMSNNMKIKEEGSTTLYKIWHEGNFDPGDGQPGGDATVIRKTFYGDGIAKTFPILDTYTPWNANVYYNGVRLFEPDDVDISSGYEIVFTEAPEAGDRIDFEGFKALLLGDHPSR